MAAPQPSKDQAQAGYPLSQQLVEVPLEQNQARDQAPAAVTEASEQVQVAVQHLHLSLAGETSSLPGKAKPTELFTSDNFPVDSRVPAKIKTKIWQEEYIDFGSLMVNPTVDGGFQLTIQNSGEALEPSTKPKCITTIDAWMQAFNVFVGIYVGRYHHEAQGLMKYRATVQNLAAWGHNWRFYDENFRFLWQSPATSVP